jgi:hypothetical protein
MTKTNSDESLRVRLRLLIDETVDDLAQSGGGSESRSVQKPNLHGRCCDVLGSPERHSPRTTVGRRMKRRERVRLYWACAQVTTSTLPSIFWLE